MLGVFTFIQRHKNKMDCFENLEVNFELSKPTKSKDNLIGMQKVIKNQLKIMYQNNISNNNEQFDKMQNHTLLLGSSGKLSVSVLSKYRVVQVKS